MRRGEAEAPGLSAALGSLLAASLLVHGCAAPAPARRAAPPAATRDDAPPPEKKPAGCDASEAIDRSIQHAIVAYGLAFPDTMHPHVEEGDGWWEVRWAPEPGGAGSHYRARLDKATCEIVSAGLGPP